MAAAIGGLWAWFPTSDEIKGCMITSMYHVELCPTSKDYIPLAQISSYLQKTIILTEDSNFYNHKGFDWNAIEKNAREGWETGVFKRGGSTITQQLAKNMFLSKDRTIIRKVLEAIITDRIEHTLSKKEILERYLNVVEFGKGVYGIKSAAKYYFRKNPSELSIVESAFLAMVLPNPIKYSSSYYRKELTPFARKRLSRIVEDMYRYHRISEEEYNTAIYQVSYFFQPEPLLEEALPVDGSQADAESAEIDDSSETDSEQLSSELEEQTPNETTEVQQ